jgi:hypothetical protein
VNYMGQTHSYPGVPDPKMTISTAAAVSELRNRKMKRDGLTRGAFFARRSRAREQAKLAYRGSPECTQGMSVKDFVAERVARYDQQISDDLVVYRKFPDQLWVALEAGTIKLYYMDMTSLDTIAQGAREIHGLNSRKEFLQVTRQLRLDPKVSAIVFHLARNCRTYLMKADLDMWLANALDRDGDAILQATAALSTVLAANQEMPKDDAREFVKENFPKISGRRFAGEIWPNARENVGLARIGRPGPKKNAKSN